MVARCDDTESGGKSNGCSHGSKTFAAWSLDMNITPSISWALFNLDALLSSLDNFETASSYQQKLEDWISRGCSATETVRQQYFKSLVDICVAKLAVPPNYDDGVTGDGYESAEYRAYEASIRDCEAVSLNTAANAQFSGAPPVLVQQGSQ